MMLNFKPTPNQAYCMRVRIQFGAFFENRKKTFNNIIAKATLYNLEDEEGEELINDNVITNLKGKPDHYQLEVGLRADIINNYININQIILGINILERNGDNVLTWPKAANMDFITLRDFSSFAGLLLDDTSLSKLMGSS